jgi:hypothetical protein
MMTPFRASLCLGLLAGGVACGYAFLRPYGRVSVAHIIMQGTTGSAQLAYPAQNLSLETETARANTEANSGEIKGKTQPTAAPILSSAPDLALALQKELSRAGCCTGLANGSWDQRSKTSMKEFLDRVNARLPVDRPEPSLLALARSTSGSVCEASQRPSVAAAATIPSLPTEAISPPPSDSLAERPEGAMSLGGPIMVPVGTIMEGEQSVASQADTVPAPSTALQQTANPGAPIRVRSSPAARPQYESRDLFRHPLGF